MYHPSLGFVRCPHLNVIGVEVQDVYDGVLYWRCMCGVAWQRFDTGDRLHAIAQPYIDAENTKAKATR